MIPELFRYAYNLPGWHTSRKIVVIQSDDWGSIRMPSENIRRRLDQHPLIDASDPYARYDTLASAGDLAALFEVLCSVRDKMGNPAVLTANCVMANPHFEKIRHSGYQKYHYEALAETFNRYNSVEALHLWKQGMDQGVFMPQFHGREHVNVNFWMNQLQQGHEGVKRAFEQGVFGVNFRGIHYRKNNFQAAWDFETLEQEMYINESIVDGINLFERQFGYKSITVIAPSYTWSANQEKLLRNKGIHAMQSIPFQLVPNPGKTKYRKRLHFTGPNYLVRNAFFEPSLHPKKNWVKDCLKRIEIAFTCKKPAIIGSHRLNFIGSLDPGNRDNNLKQFGQLLSVIVKRWPDVEFMSSNILLKAIV